MNQSKENKEIEVDLTENTIYQDVKKQNHATQIKYTSTLSRNKGFRVLAFLSVILLAGLFIATFISAIMGSQLFVGFLILTMLVAVMLYAILWFGKVMYAHGEKNRLKEKIKRMQQSPNKTETDENENSDLE